MSRIHVVGGSDGVDGRPALCGKVAALHRILAIGFGPTAAEALSKRIDVPICEKCAKSAGWRSWEIAPGGKWAASELEVEFEGRDLDLDGDEDRAVLWSNYDPATGKVRINRDTAEPIARALTDLSNAADDRAEGHAGEVDALERQIARHAATGLASMSGVARRLVNS